MISSGYQTTHCWPWDINLTLQIPKSAVFLVYYIESLPQKARFSLKGNIVSWILSQY